MSELSIDSATDSFMQLLLSCTRNITNCLSVNENSTASFSGSFWASVTVFSTFSELFVAGSDGISAWAAGGEGRTSFESHFCKNSASKSEI